ncbi:MAG: hypothetical protein BroJett040_23710 [Oligoflexia bacterium]|nr:MAG: hypothetical protein BroJett040_23710 [Oligoflexia bacterium]
MILLVFSLSACSGPQTKPISPQPDQKAEGIRFSCSLEQITNIEVDLEKYFQSLSIGTNLFTVIKNLEGGTLTYTLNTDPSDTNTLDFHKRPEFKLQDEVILLPLKNKKNRKVSTVSKKEIVLALMQHGRLTEFNKENCSATALIDHVGIRQNIVAWTEKLSWVWPDGEPAFWNKKYWNKGDPVGNEPLHVMINDMFMNQNKYSIGCYTATKIVVIQGVLDYYHRVKKDPIQLQKIEARLMADHDPLVNTEPGCMWSFEDDYDIKKLSIPGKLLTIQYGIAARNVVPGDWIYLLNTDIKTKTKIGYEGSNAIYLGRNKLDDYYADHNHSYQFDEKMNEVYQWRNGVFSRSRDFKKIKPLSSEEKQRLYNTPEKGGLLMDLRVFPYFFI